MRRARPEDAAEAALLLRESIAELCVADHQNDSETLDRWLSNKVPERVRELIIAPEHVTVVSESVVAETAVAEAAPCETALGKTGPAEIVVAERERRLLGVGLVTSKGEVQLCYVRPIAVGRGVGRALLFELERVSTEAGLGRTFLTSTSGARGFYEHAGYVATGPGRGLFGTVVGYPYEKRR